ncbi:MAG: tyrosine-type recombinase/integrase [Anaerolineae bacterium]|nr:tyrosine-type recombinase/integrase [Anaerolineae bacterium]
MILSGQNAAATFNFLLALPGRTSSPHTQRAYFRWVDTYLVDVAGLKPTQGDQRIHRMSALSVRILYDHLSAAQLRAWLGILAGRGHGKQGIDQARAAIVTLTQLLVEAGWLDDYIAAMVSNVRPPKAAEGQRPGRWLAKDEIRLLMLAGRQIATSQNQELRNHVVLTMLCTMALRRDELASARWGDLMTQNDRPIMRVHGKGRRTAMIDIPRPVLQALDHWRRVAAPGELRPPAYSALVRRLWKGGRVSRFGLTPDGIWLIIDQASAHAGLGHVAPHDLRRSVAGALQESGVTIDKISRLLRHRNVAITERYLSRLPMRNEGGILMSDLLGLEDDDDQMLWDEQV